MAKILAFAGSNSKNSINKQLVEYTCSLFDDHEVTLLDLNDYEMPLYGIDHEKEYGIPQKAKYFKTHIEMTDGIIISFAEHNGSFAVAIKNIIDWCSRLEGKLWADKPMFLMATSPGARGGSTVLEQAVARVPFNGGGVQAHFSLPNFKENFSKEEGIKNSELSDIYKQKIVKFTSAI